MLENQILDIKVLFSYLHPEVKEVVSTNFLIEYYEIDDSDIKRHSAMGDCLLIRRIVLELFKEYRKNAVHDISIEKPINIQRIKLQKLIY